MALENLAVGPPDPNRSRAARSAAVATLAAWFAPRLALRLAAPTAVLAGTAAATWSGPAAFVHPGSDVGAPIAGRITALAPEGLVAAGAPLASVSPAPAGPAAVPLLPAWARWNGLPAFPPGAVSPAGAAALGARDPGPFCLGRRCAQAAGHGSGGADTARPSVPAARVVRAAQAGWFYPGVDPLAAMSASALGDLAPGAVRDPAAPTRLGQSVSAGAPIGELGAPWSGLWVVALPETALPAVSAGGGALAIGWRGGGAAQPATLLAAGPDQDGRFLAVLAPVGAGPQPGPPPRTEAVVRLPHAEGEIVPAGALRAGPAVLVLGPEARPGRPRRVGVQVLSLGARTAVVEGIPPGVRVLAHPGWMTPWVAGAWSTPAEIPPEGPRG